MHINNIVKFVNDKLAGEMLIYDQLLIFLDSTIDEINVALNSCFPAFSEFNGEEHSNYPDYNFFPDKYIRMVVIPGAAAKFYAVDEEGAQVAPMFDSEYRNALNIMVRDYSTKVPYRYREDHQGYVYDPCEEDCCYGGMNVRRFFE